MILILCKFCEERFELFKLYWFHLHDAHSEEIYR